MLCGLGMGSECVCVLCLFVCLCVWPRHGQSVLDSMRAHVHVCMCLNFRKCRCTCVYVGGGVHVREVAYCLVLLLSVYVFMPAGCVLTSHLV